MKTILKKLTAAAVITCVILLLTVNVFAAALTKEEAVNKALKNAGFSKADVTSLKTDSDKNEYEISFKDKRTGDRYEYEISIKSGKVKEIEVNYRHGFNPSSEKVGKAKAIAAAAKAAGVKKSVVKKGTCRYKKDDGEWIYEIKFRTSKCSYEYEVLAPTGRIIEYSKEFKR